MREGWCNSLGGPGHCAEFAPNERLKMRVYVCVRGVGVGSRGGCFAEWCSVRQQRETKREHGYI